VGIEESSSGFPGFLRSEIEGSIVQRFEAIVRQYPGRIALSDRGHRWTYQDLNRLANRAAHAILAQSDSLAEPLPVVLGHTATAIVALIGVLKAGRAYSVIDPSHPRARLRQILDELRSDLLVTDTAGTSLAEEFRRDGLRLILIDDLDDKLPVDNPRLIPLPPGEGGAKRRVRASTLAVIFYTSGSTGQPKGVEHDHRKTLHRIWWETNANGISGNDHISSIFSPSFSASVTDIFGSLLNGATLCLYDVKAEGLDPLADWLTQEAITLFHIPVAAARQFLDSLPQAARFPSVRHLVPSGPIYRTDLDRFWLHFPNCKLLSHMGSSETGVIAQMVVTPATQFAGNVVPLGFPVEDKEVLILDETGATLPAGHIGEIAIRSRFLSTGYWRRQDLTAKVFLADPEGGDRRIYRMGDLGRITNEGYLEYLDRRDAQVKIRGYRVEISEVEAAFHRQQGVKEVVVAARENQTGEKKLVAYVVARDGSKCTSGGLRLALSAMLPDYMVPTSFVFVKEIPRTDNGKLDASRLPDPGRDRPSLATPYAAPRNPLEEELAKLWAGVLELDGVGIHDNFIELGGHSLLATKLISRILQKHNVRLSPRILLESSTVATQAASIAENLQASAEGVVEQLLDQLEQLSDEEAERFLTEDGPSL